MAIQFAVKNPGLIEPASPNDEFTNSINWNKWKEDDAYGWNFLEWPPTIQSGELFYSLVDGDPPDAQTIMTSRFHSKPTTDYAANIEFDHVVVVGELVLWRVQLIDHANQNGVYLGYYAYEGQQRLRGGVTRDGSGVQTNRYYTWDNKYTKLKIYRIIDGANAYYGGGFWDSVAEQWLNVFYGTIGSGANALIPNGRDTEIELTIVAACYLGGVSALDMGWDNFTVTSSHSDLIWDGSD